MCCFKQELQAVLSGLLGGPVPSDQPLMEAGLDSIGAVELRNAVSAKFGIELPATVTFDYPSADALAGYVVQQMAPKSHEQQQQQQAALGIAVQAPGERVPDHQHIAAQLAATVSELLGFDVPADQVSKHKHKQTKHTCMQIDRLCCSPLPARAAT